MLWASGDRSEDNLAKVMWGAATLMNLEELQEDFNNLLITDSDMSKFGAHAMKALSKNENCNIVDGLKSNVQDSD